MTDFNSARFQYVRLGKQHASESYLSWLNDPEINQYLEVRHYKNDLNSLKEYLEVMELSDKEFLYGIYADNMHIGNIKVGPVDFNYKHADLGLIIGDKNWWNKGVGSEAIYAMTKYCFDVLKLVKVEAGCYESNEFSKKAFLKLGFKEEGFIRDHVYHKEKLEGVYKLGITLYDWESYAEAKFNEKFKVVF